jgi:hypothetical protein
MLTVDYNNLQGHHNANTDYKACMLCRFGHNCIFTSNMTVCFVELATTIHAYVFTMYIWYFWQGNCHTYGHIRCTYTVLANPNVLWFPCLKYRIYTVYIWFWPTLMLWSMTKGWSWPRQDSPSARQRKKFG